MSDRRILVVAHRTAASPKLLAAVAERAARGPCSFTLLVPRPYWDPDTEEAAITLEFAIPLLDTAAGSHVHGIVGATDPYEAVRQTLEREKVRRGHRLDAARACLPMAAPRPRPPHRAVRRARERGDCGSGRAHPLAGNRVRLIGRSAPTRRAPAPVWVS